MWKLDYERINRTITSFNHSLIEQGNRCVFRILSIYLYINTINFLGKYMFICKICGLVYPSEPSKCLNDGYKDFEEIREHIAMPSLAIRFSEIQENIFPLSDSYLPMSLINLDTKNKFYYDFKPHHLEFPVKMKFSDIIKDNEVIVDSISSDKSSINLTLKYESLLSRVYFRAKNKSNFEEIIDNSNPIVINCFDEEFNKGDELKVRNIIIKYLGVI